MKCYPINAIKHNNIKDEFTIKKFQFLLKYRSIFLGELPLKLCLSKNKVSKHN